MEKDLIFFGNNGITDTQANRVADMAKLSYVDEEESLSSLNFINENIETLNGSTSKALSIGSNDITIIQDKVEYIGELKSLCAWLREAVSAHQRLIQEISNLSFSEYLKRNNIDEPENPFMENVITENDVISNFDIKKRNRYYYLEAHASTIGKFIHKDGSIDKARKKYYDKLSNPRNTSEMGSEIIIHTYTPSIDKDSVEELFYSLQQKHAEYQKELNSIKSEIQSKIINDKIEKTKKYEALSNEYSLKYNELFAKFNSFKAEESKRIASLKIVIPNQLQNIYYRVADLGNKK